MTRGGPAKSVKAMSAGRQPSPKIGNRRRITARLGITRTAATGLGLTGSQRFWRVKAPLALPVIVTGVRTAAVEVIGSATLAAFVGAGGLGTFITSGITLMDERMLLSGALLVTLLALLTEWILARLELRVTPPGTTQA